MSRGNKLWCITLVISLLLSLFTACEEETTTKKRRRSRDDDEKEDIVTEFTLDDLVGSWTVKTEDYEATLVFEEEDDIYKATWTVFDFDAEIWNEETFQIKELSGFTMLSLMENGKIESFSFAPFGQTLYFEGLYYTNPDKYVGLPADTAKFAFIRDGQQTTVMHNVFLGMTYDEVKRAYPSVRELEEYSYRTCPYGATSYDTKIEVPNHSAGWTSFSFDENKQLAQASVRLYRSEYSTSSYYTINSAAEALLAEATENYGEYTMTESSYTDYKDENHVYHTYRWDLGNVVCEIKFDYIDTTDNLDGVTKTYTLNEYATS